jgi:hypothetical protein
VKRKSPIIRDEIIKTLNLLKEPVRWTQLFEETNKRRRKRGERVLGSATLTSHLKDLVDQGVVKRIIDDSTYPPAVYYELVQKLNEKVPYEVVSLWRGGKLKPLDNPWRDNFFVFTSVLEIQKMPLETRNVMRQWFSKILSELEHVILQSYIGQLENSVPRKTLGEAQYHRTNSWFFECFKDRIRRNGVVKTVDEAGIVQKKMYTAALAYLIEKEYLSFKNGKVAGFKPDDELVKVKAKKWAKSMLTKTLPRDLIEKDERLMKEKIEEYCKKIKKVNIKKALIKDRFDFFMQLHKGSFIDLTHKPADMEDPYFVIWLTNKIAPRIFKDFPLLPQEQKEYESMKKKMEETKESFEKMKTYLKPINVLITAKLPVIWAP